MKQAGGARLRDVTVPLFAPGTGYGTLLEFNNIGQFIFTLIDILPGDQDLITGPCYPLLIDCYRGPLSICLD
ncbi:unnamed protein product [Adineta steineri]|uniref:Uncharacterized protein n=1 Tax=Adineta steineri TaxID=433720 RepID=A0A814GS28_9BILA|nr:unnamed protein product [Adineta steineri]